MPPPASSSRLVIGLSVSTGVVWGAGGLASKRLVSSGVDPFMMTAVPFLVGALVAWVWTLGRTRPGGRAIRDGLMVGAINSSAPALLFNLAYLSVPAGTVALILSLGPVFTALAAHFAFADEPLNARKGGGLALSVAGVAVLGLSARGTAGGSLGGMGLALAGAVAGGLTAIVNRRVAVRHGAAAIVAPQLSAAGLLPLLLALGMGRPLAPPDGWRLWQMATAAAIGVIASFGGFRMIMSATQLGTTGQVSVAAYVIPVVGVIGGALFLHEPLTPFTVGGGALILAGIGLVGGATGKPARLVRSAG